MNEGDEAGVSSFEAMLPAARESGDYGDLVHELHLGWARVAPEGGAALRAILDSIPKSDWHSDPWLVTAYGASFRSVDTTSRSAALPYFAAARGLVGDESLAVVDAGVNLHYSAALRGLGRIGDALDAANAGLARVGEGPIELEWRITIEAKLTLQAGLARLFLGDFDAAMSDLRLAYGLAVGSLHPWERTECCGGLAILEYTNGNFDRALGFAAEARDAAAGTPYFDSRFGASAQIVELLVAVERNQADRARELAPSVAAAASRCEWEPLGYYARATQSIITEDYAAGFELLRECRQAYRGWQPIGPILTISEGLRATFLLRSGGLEAAWDILGSLQPTVHHANCPARFLAHLRLITGDAAGALAELRECEALGDTHSSRTLVDVLLLTAAANYTLGMPERGEMPFDRGVRLAAKNGMRVPFRLVPPAIMQAMVAAASTRSQPAEVAAMLEDVRGLAMPVTETAQLSEREREIVRSLARDRTATEIADDLFISVNTVKSHLKSVYRKLGVGSRSEAMRRARELGLHVEITLD